jgi:hypothetical protein
VSTKYGGGVTARFIIGHLLALAFLNALLVALEPLFDLLLQTGGLGSALSLGVRMTHQLSLLLRQLQITSDDQTLLVSA